MPIKKFKRFLGTEAASGILLFIAAMLAIGLVNSPLSHYYTEFLEYAFVVQVGELELNKPLLLWINDGLMAIFFFLVGLEIKREFVAGELSDPSRIVLPVIAAFGGMSVPAVIYASLNWGDPIAMRGWAVPTATDIAFALGVLALLGNRIPLALKLYLMTLAIIDDLGAIIIIALFYTENPSVDSLIIASITLGGLFLLNRFKVISIAPYLLLSVVLWAAVLKSGVHATLAGVLAAFFIPYRKAAGERLTQLQKLEVDLHSSVSFAILPIFAFANAGLSFSGMKVINVFDPVPLGIALSLFFGNQIGVFGFSWLVIKCKFAELPQHTSWLQLYGVACLCGIGFTMSLFVGTLAFHQNGLDIANDKLGIFLGSLASGLLGYFILRYASDNGPEKPDKTGINFASMPRN